MATNWSNTFAAMQDCGFSSGFDPICRVWSVRAAFGEDILATRDFRPPYEDFEATRLKSDRFRENQDFFRFR